MSINDTGLLKLVRANAVSCIIAESFEISIDLPKILSTKNARIWFSLPDFATIISLYARLKRDSSISVDYVKQDDTYNDSSVVLSTSKFLKKRLMGYFENGHITKSKIDFCDIIVLGGVSLWTIENTIIMNLWRNIIEEKNDIKIPRLVLSLFNLEIDNNIPFDISQSYFYIETESTTKIEYYSRFFQPNENEVLNDMFDIVKQKHEIDDLSMKYLVYCQSYKDCAIFASKLKDIDTIVVYFSSNDIDEKAAIRNNTRKIKDKRIVILSPSSLVPLQDVSVVFDCMTEKLEYKTPNESIKLKNDYISKTIAEERKNIALKYCYRMCTKEKYDSLKSQHSLEYKRVPLTKTFLEIVDRGFNPQKFLRDIIMPNILRDEIRLLEETKMIDKKRITRLGEFALNVNLSRYGAIFLHRWAMTQQQVFPGIVLSCIIDKADSMFFYIPMRQQDEPIEKYDLSVKEHFDKYFKKWASESILECYLNMWATYANEIKTLKPDKEELKIWCNENSINYKTMNELLQLIVQCFDKLEYMTRKQIIIGKFNPGKLLIMANPIFLSVYSRNICQLVDIKNYKYIDEEYKNFFLDTRRHYNPYVRVPYKLFAFSKVSIKKNRKDIRNIIFFHPVDNRFVKESKIEAPIRKTDLAKVRKEEYGKFPVPSVYEQKKYTPYSIETKPSEYKYEPSPEYRPSSPSYPPPPDSPEYRPSSPSYPPPPDSPEYRPSSPRYPPPPDSPEYRPSSPVEETFEVKHYNPNEMGEIVQFYSKSKDIQDLGGDIPSNWRKVLSNFYIHPIVIDGKKYNSIEHYFHAMKAMDSDKPEMADKFEIGGSAGTEPLDAKRAGGKGAYSRENAKLDIERWNKNRDRVMYDALKQRLKTDGLFREILIRTSERNIYLLHFERSGVKSYWGGSLKDDQVNGQNVLGRLMMMLRENISTPVSLAGPAQDVIDIENEEEKLFREAFDDLAL